MTTEKTAAASANPIQKIAGLSSLRWLILSAVVVVADQLTKLEVVKNLVLYERINLLPMLDLVRLHNTGAAFSLLADAGGWQHWLFVGIAVGFSLVLLWWQWQLPVRTHRTLAVGLALVLGGAVGNLIDRLMQGYVVDFVLVYYQNLAWPAFNVADSAITCGVVLILIDGMLLEPRRKRAIAQV